MTRRNYKAISPTGLYKNIKIGRLTYKIFEGDVFGYNVAYYQLLTQYYEKGASYYKCTPTLSKTLSKEIFKLFEFEVSSWNGSVENKLYKVVGFKDKCFLPNKGEI